MEKIEENIYHNEFLEYLNKNKKGSHIVFDETCSDYSTFENEVIHSVSDMVDSLMLFVLLQTNAII